VFLDKDRLHALNHRGEFFSVAGPLNISRSPQGQPVIFQAGSSEDGRALAAEVAEGIFASSDSFEDAREFYADLKRRTAAAGRNPDHLLIMPALHAVLAATDEEARSRADAEIAGLDLKKALVQLGRPFNYHDFEQYPLDEPFPELGSLGSNGYRGHAELIKRVAREQKLSLRQAAWRFGVPRSPFVGSPLTVADQIERWFNEGAADGFIYHGSSPADLESFLGEVVPILRARGLFRREYSATTLRGHLGLPIPENRHTRARREQQELLAEQAVAE
jgi:alkanesulfonate monooxygenase SsuD/methylene tetrahydromethanopterin reductase-like flavin-dependent oxidoreductase (luciferase family)